MLDIFTYLMQPQVFFFILAVFFIISILAVFISSRGQKKIHNSDHSIIQKDRIKISELETIISENEREYVRKINELQKQIDGLKKELSVKDQMYEGIKGQFEEMERNQERSEEKGK